MFGQLHLPGPPMSRKHLTPKQQEFYDYLTGYVTEHRQWPTYREIVEHFDYRSPNSVTQNLQALAKKGYLRKDEHGYDLAAHPAAPQAGGIHVRGSVADGQIRPLAGATLSLQTLFPELDRLYALRIERDRLDGAPLEDGDHVLVAEGEVPDGEVGVVAYEGRLALRRVYHTDTGVHLRPITLSGDGGGAVHAPHARVLGPCAGFVTRRGIYRHLPLEDPSPETVPVARVA